MLPRANAPVYEEGVGVTDAVGEGVAKGEDEGAGVAVGDGVGVGGGAVRSFHE
jgi:hypothetical protein